MRSNPRKKAVCKFGKSVIVVLCVALANKPLAMTNFSHFVPLWHQIKPSNQRFSNFDFEFGLKNP